MTTVARKQASYSCRLLSIVVALVALSLTVDRVRCDDRKSSPDLIRSRGFDVEEHDVISQNYPLKVYRIVNPLADKRNLNPIPIVCAHGVSFDSVNMLTLSKNARPRVPKVNERVILYAMENGTDDRGLYFMLSNNNYDVWFLESRATNERNQHRIRGYKNKPNEKSFWDFSLDEQINFDLPRQIEFILHKTNSKKAAYIAYSQSTTLMFGLLSIRPEWADKLVVFIAMAPVVYTKHLRGVVKPSAATITYTATSTARAAIPSWFLKPWNRFWTYYCSISFLRDTVCRLLWRSMSGTDNGALLDNAMTEDMFKSTSLKSYEQYVQNAVSGDFRMYDYKSETRNMEEYGQPVPPAYNVSQITLRTITLFRGTNDYMSTPEDQMLLLARLRVPLYEDHILINYSHIDFIVSPTIVRDINEPIIRILDKLTGRPVERVSHTLGHPNPQVVGTKLHMDVKEDEQLARGTDKRMKEVPKASPNQLLEVTHLMESAR